MIDELAIIVAPMILGGGGNVRGVHEALALEHISVSQIEWATLIEYRVKT